MFVSQTKFCEKDYNTPNRNNAVAFLVPKHFWALQFMHFHYLSVSDAICGNYLQLLLLIYDIINA